MRFIQITLNPQIIYLNTEQRDLFDVSATLYSLFMFVGMGAQYVIYVRRSVDVRRLIDDVYAWTNQRKMCTARRASTLDDLFFRTISSQNSN